MPDLKLHTRSGLYIRDNKDDEVVANEVKAYEALPVQGLGVLDIGSHVGFSMQYFLQRGAAWVVGFEPDPETFEILKHNMQQYANAAVSPAAIVGADINEVDFYRKKRYRNGTLFQPAYGNDFEKITVPAIPFRTAIETYQPAVLKVDVEGGEYSYDFNNLPACIRHIAMEFHLGRKVFKEAAPGLLQTLLDQGFTLVKAPDFSVLFCSVAVLAR